MAKLKLIGMPFLAASLLLGAQVAYSHCDSVDGPVAKAVEKALNTGNLYPVLAYAPATAESELRTSFDQARSVRAMGSEARALADRSFLETAIRLHRAGEGASFTGIKPAGIDYGPAIPAAERAVETGDLSTLKAVLIEEIEHALHERLAHVREAQSATREPRSAGEVADARKRVSAELGFITFAETVHQAIGGNSSEHAE
jgi:uncharacterized protein DUF6448